MLKAYGVRYVFGVPGDTGLAFYDALRQAHNRDEIALILARDERSAAYMADVYARVSFRPGVCDGPSGAGATYLASGLGEPHASSIPVIALTSDTPVGQEGRNVLTALDQPALFSPITKWCPLVKQASRIPDLRMPMIWARNRKSLLLPGARPPRRRRNLPTRKSRSSKP